MPWHTLLVLGGIGSGHAGYAESLITGDGDDRAVTTPRRITAAGADLPALAEIVAAAAPEEVLLVDDLTGWVADHDPQALARLVETVRACPAQVVLVSGEAGWWPVADDDRARQRAEAVGAVNRALAGTVDAVVSVVAGQPRWLKGGPAGTGPAVVAGPPAGGAAERDLSRLPSPDEPARTAARAALTRLGPVSLGRLADLVEIVAGWQGTPNPQPWQQVRVVALSGPDEPTAAALRAGQGPLAQLADAAGATVRLVETAAGALADRPPMSESDVEQALTDGWSLAGQAADEGVDLLVLAVLGDHTATAAAVTTMLVPGSEPAALLGRVRTDQGRIDDQEWIRRCAAARDAVRRARAAGRGTGRLVLAELGGPLLTTAAGLLLGAAARRTPVLLDGPAGAAAALAARNLAATARRWWLVPDTGDHPLVTHAAGPLGQQPVLDLRLELGEGTGALAALPLLQRALALAAALSRPTTPG